MMKTVNCLDDILFPCCLKEIMMKTFVHCLVLKSNTILAVLQAVIRFASVVTTVVVHALLDLTWASYCSKNSLPCELDLFRHSLPPEV